MKKYVFESLKFFCAAILCTILSAFATPALADLDPCRNLFDIDWLLKASGWTESNGVYSGACANLALVGSGMVQINFEENTQYTISYDITEPAVTYARFVIHYTDGTSSQTQQLAGDGTSVTTTNAGKTVDYITFTYGSGQTISLSNFQIEKGTTATAYTPYNPLCATCDGTIVNYVSATGTGVQNGTPTPTNPIEPVFYQQGNMVLRKVGDYADSYDATTGKITRRVGVKVFDGTEGWLVSNASNNAYRATISGATTTWGTIRYAGILCNVAEDGGASAVVDNNKVFFANDFNWNQPIASTSSGLKQWLAQQYAAGTPVTVYYPLAEETTEDWPASYCETPIKIATTKYNETKFSPLNTALQNAISVVDSVVSNTITQAGRIATLQTQKQTRPNDIADDNEKCPAGKKCLLVEDASGTPHWYEIVENAWDLPVGYTQLQYIESTGEQYLDLGYAISKTMGFEIKSRCLGAAFVFGGRASSSSAVSGMNYDASGFRIGIRMGSVTLFDTLVWQEGTDYTVSIQNGNVSIDGRTVSSATYGDDYYTGKAYLFGVNNNGHLSPTVYNKNRIYYFKMYNNNTLTQNLIPAKNASGAVGMYDTVSGAFFTNAGTGEFVAGPVAE